MTTQSITGNAAVVRSLPTTKLHEYMTFRADLEGVAHTLTPVFYLAHFANGCRTFFGITLNDAGDIVEDVQNPKALAEYARQTAI